MRTKLHYTQRVDSTRSTLKVAIVGAGLIGRAHARAFRALGSMFQPMPARVELTVVADADARLASDAQVRWEIGRVVPSWSEVAAADDVDIACVALPNHEHRAAVEALTAAGKHVLCEKPLTVRADEARQLFGLANSRNLVLMEAFMYRHHPVVSRLSDLIASGDIGEVQVIRSSFSFTVADPATDIRLSAELAGGALRDVGCYCINLSRLVLGEDPVKALAVQTVTDTGVDERTHALLLYPSGGTSLFDVSIRAPLHFGASIVGTEAVVEIPSPWYAHLLPRT
jgi:xylose dehydrogenase (NAD/NADP)